jgi:hypothetical protein
VLLSRARDLDRLREQRRELQAHQRKLSLVDEGAKVPLGAESDDEVVEGLVVTAVEAAASRAGGGSSGSAVPFLLEAGSGGRGRPKVMPAE